MKEHNMCRCKTYKQHTLYITEIDRVAKHSMSSSVGIFTFFYTKLDFVDTIKFVFQYDRLNNA